MLCVNFTTCFPSIQLCYCVDHCRVWWMNTDSLSLSGNCSQSLEWISSSVSLALARPLNTHTHSAPSKNPHLQLQILCTPRCGSHTNRSYGHPFNGVHTDNKNWSKRTTVQPTWYMYCVEFYWSLKARAAVKNARIRGAWSLHTFGKVIIVGNTSQARWIITGFWSITTLGMPPGHWEPKSIAGLLLPVSLEG